VRRNCWGAFLLEALLAVFILSVALVGLIRGLLSSLNATVEAERYAQAIQVADNALLEIVRLNGQKVNSPVTLENQGEKLAAKIVIKSMENVPTVDVVQQAQLTVTWPGKVKDKTIEAVTLLFGPADEKK
jgi:Tfp pilus assembly protein PilV